MNHQPHANATCDKHPTGPHHRGGDRDRKPNLNHCGQQGTLRLVTEELHTDTGYLSSWLLPETRQPRNYHVCARPQQASLQAGNPFTLWEEDAAVENVCLEELGLSHQYEAMCVFMHPGKRPRNGDGGHTAAFPQR